MDDWKQRTELLLGGVGVDALSRSRVLVVGVGGVGAYAVEMLARAGVGHLDIVDGDKVGVSNINRQLPALHSSVGQLKVEVMRRRIADINPDAEVKAFDVFITENSVVGLLDDGNYDFVVDAIDSVAPKVALIRHCLSGGIKIVSSMGAGGRVDASKVRYADIWETYNDGLAKAVRTRLKAGGLRKRLPVVWSEEVPEKASVMLTDEIANKRSSYGTVSYLPAIFGCMLGAYVIRKLTGK